MKKIKSNQIFCAIFFIKKLQIKNWNNKIYNNQYVKTNLYKACEN